MDLETTPAPVGESLFSQALEHTRGRSPASFEQWFTSIQFEGFEHGVLGLTARDEFVRDWVKAHFLPDLLTNLGRLSGEASSALRVSWNISNRLTRPVCEPKRTAPRAVKAEAVPNSRRSERPTGVPRYARAQCLEAP